MNGTGTVNIGGIPESLRNHARWCCWKYEDRGGRKTKVPYNPHTGGKAMSSERTTFGTFEEALSAYKNGPYDGLGIGLFDDLCGIDIDGCITEDGHVSSLAVSLARRMSSYTERSPSGTGLHIYFRASDIPYDLSKYYIKNPKNKVELYVSGVTSRFLTVTGYAITGCGLNERSDAVLDVLDTYMRRPEQRAFTTPVDRSQPLSDSELLEKAKEAKHGVTFEELMAGNTSRYGGDESRADMALCFILALYTQDAEQIDRIFRTSGLLRKKWDRPTGGTTYGKMTIDKALSFVSQRAAPHCPRRKPLYEQIATANKKAVPTGYEAGQSRRLERA